MKMGKIVKIFEFLIKKDKIIIIFREHGYFFYIITSVRIIEAASCGRGCSSQVEKKKIDWVEIDGLFSWARDKIANSIIYNYNKH